MEVRVYFWKSSVEARLKKNDITPINDEKPWSNPWGPFKEDEKNPKLAYCTLTSLTHKIPAFTTDLKTVKVSLHAILAAEQNDHIKQGHGQVGTSAWEVNFEAEEFEPPTSQQGISFAKAYRAVISIWIRGDNEQSVRDCYDKIRKGEMGGDWKGIPSSIITTAPEQIEKY